MSYVNYLHEYPGIMSSKYLLDPLHLGTFRFGISSLNIGPFTLAFGSLGSVGYTCNFEFQVEFWSINVLKTKNATAQNQDTGLIGIVEIIK